MTGSLPCAWCNTPAACAAWCILANAGPPIPEAVIRELQQAIGADELRTIPENFTPGDEVEITEGAMRGLRAVVTRVMPGRERIAVLMEFLGRQTMIELPLAFPRQGRRRTRGDFSRRFSAVKTPACGSC